LASGVRLAMPYIRVRKSPPLTIYDFVVYGVLGTIFLGAVAYVVSAVWF